MEKIDLLRNKLSATNSKIQKLNVVTSGIDDVSKSFHLGMVGGSGKNVQRLNRKREQALDKTIDRAVELSKLYEQQRTLENQIKFIEESESRALKGKTRAELLAEYWRNLKAGDELNIGNPNGNPIIAKKNAKSCVTQGGTTWKAEEIIGKEATKLI
jgi:hypothetical protein